MLCVPQGELASGCLSVLVEFGIVSKPESIRTPCPAPAAASPAVWAHEGHPPQRPGLPGPAQSLPSLPRELLFGRSRFLGGVRV